MQTNELIELEVNRILSKYARWHILANQILLQGKIVGARYQLDTIVARGQRGRWMRHVDKIADLARIVHPYSNIQWDMGIRFDRYMIDLHCDFIWALSEHYDEPPIGLPEKSPFISDAIKFAAFYCGGPMIPRSYGI